MTLKQRRDDKLRKEFFKFYFITSGLLYLVPFVTSEPVCYTQTSLDESNRYFKTVDCDGTDEICKRFSSREEVNVFDILNSECGFPDNYQLTTKKTEAIQCQEMDLPAINSGFFNCSGYSVGDKCNLTCDNGYYPSSSNEMVCEEKGDFKTANWTAENFQCSECSKWNVSHRWNGTEYEITNTSQTWHESRRLCESYCAHLVTIEDEEENDFVRNITSGYFTGYYIWIGLNDIEKEDTWEWSDDSVATYRNWDETEPNGGEPEDCVDIRAANGKWIDYDCSRKFPAVCERSILLE